MKSNLIMTTVHVFPCICLNYLVIGSVTGTVIRAGHPTLFKPSLIPGVILEGKNISFNKFLVIRSSG